MLRGVLYNSIHVFIKSAAHRFSARLFKGELRPLRRRLSDRIQRVRARPGPVWLQTRRGGNNLQRVAGNNNAGNAQTKKSAASATATHGTTTEPTLMVSGEELPSAYGAPPAFSRSRFSGLVTAYVLPPGGIYAGAIFQATPCLITGPILRIHRNLNLAFLTASEWRSKIRSSRIGDDSG